MFCDAESVHIDELKCLPETGALTDLECEILAFENRRWTYAGAKEQSIREQFDISAARYYQILNRLIDTEAAFMQDPKLVTRLRRLRAQKQKQRSAARLQAS